MPLDRNGVAGAELVRGPEQAGIEEVHQRPQFGQPVLHRGPGQRDSLPGAQPPHRPGRLGQAVLHRLRLVQHDPPPLVAGQFLDVPGRGGVRGDHEVGLRQPARQFPLPQSLPPVVGVHAQSGCEPLRLPLPVADQRHRAQQQRRWVVRALGAVHRLQRE